MRTYAIVMFSYLLFATAYEPAAPANTELNTNEDKQSVGSLNNNSNMCTKSCSVNWDDVLTGFTWKIENIHKPDSNLNFPNTGKVTFEKNGILTMHEGYLAAANVIHPATGNPYAYNPNGKITYEIYGDIIRVKIPNAVAQGMKMVIKEGEIFLVGLDNDILVSKLTKAQ
jgi:hypothetical protein